MTIYFMKWHNLVKIGESCHPNLRLKEIEMEYKVNGIELLATTDKYSEKDIHYIFKKWKFNGEWFHLSDNILAFIDKIKESNSYTLENAITKGLINPLLEQDMRWKHMINDVFKDDQKIHFLPTPEEQFKESFNPLIQLCNALCGRTMIYCYKCGKLRDYVYGRICSTCKSQFTQYINKSINMYIRNGNFNEGLKFIEKMKEKAIIFGLENNLEKLEIYNDKIKRCIA